MSEKRLGKTYTLSMEKRVIILKRLREVLEPRGRLVFVVIFGSFISKSFFRDIDLGVYLKEFHGDAVDAAVYAEELSAELTRRIGIPIDVVVLNYAPMWLKLRALKGKVIIDRDPIQRLALKLAAIDNHLTQKNLC